MNKGNGKYLLTGIERAVQCNYKIENDYFTLKRLNLFVKLGKLKNPVILSKNFMDSPAGE